MASARDYAPLQAYTAYRTSSVLNALACSRKTFPQVNRLESLNEDPPFHLHSRFFSLGDVGVLAVSSTGHRIELEDHSRLGLMLPIAGRIGVDDGRRQAAAGPGDILLPGLGRRSTLCGRAYEGLVVMVRTPVVEDRLSRELGGVTGHLLEGLGAVAGTSAAAAGLADWVHGIVRDIDRGGAIARFETARASASQLLLDNLTAILLERGEVEGRVVAAVAASDRQVARAEAFIRANASRAMSVADIAEAVGTSMRSLQLAFQRHRETTPRAFLLACRLDLLHRRLARAAPGVRVVDVAPECGIAHLGRCAAAYRRRFGETPSQTLARARRRA